MVHTSHDISSSMTVLFADQHWKQSCLAGTSTSGPRVQSISSKSHKVLSFSWYWYIVPMTLIVTRSRGTFTSKNGIIYIFAGLAEADHESVFSVT